jgi:DNA primase
MVLSGVLQTLIEQDYGYKHYGSNWGRASKHDSLVVDEEKQRWYWNSEDLGGDVLQYLILIRKLDIKKAKELLASITGIGTVVDDTKVEIAVPYEKLVDMFWEFGKTNRDYWYSRKLTDSTIDRNRLGYYDGWSVLPLYEDGKFVNFQCRRDEPAKRIKYWYKHAQPVLMNTEILQLVDTIFITEGTVDSILLNQEGIASVAHTGGSGYWNNNWYSLFSRVKNIFYIADNDIAGRGASKRVADGLGISRVKIYNFETDVESFDTVDYFRGGGSAKELKELVEKDSKFIFEIGDNDANVGRKEIKNRIGRGRSSVSMA